MKDDQFDDLKQFIETTVSQSEERLKDELASKADLKAVEKKLEVRMDSGFGGVAEALDTLGNNLEARSDDHESRISTLEAAA